MNMHPYYENRIKKMRYKKDRQKYFIKIVEKYTTYQKNKYINKHLKKKIEQIYLGKKQRGGNDKNIEIINNNIEDLKKLINDFWNLKNNNLKTSNDMIDKVNIKLNQLKQEYEENDIITTQQINIYKNNNKQLQTFFTILLIFRDFLNIYRRFYNKFYEIYERFDIVSTNEKFINAINNSDTKTLKNEYDLSDNEIITYKKSSKIINQNNELLFSALFNNKKISAKFETFKNKFTKIIQIFESTSKEYLFFNDKSSEHYSFPKNVENIVDKFIKMSQTEELRLLKANIISLRKSLYKLQEYDMEDNDKFISEELNILNGCHCTTQCNFQNKDSNNLHWCFTEQNCHRGDQHSNRGWIKSCNPLYDLNKKASIYNQELGTIGEKKIAYSNKKKILCVKTHDTTGVDIFSKKYNCSNNEKISLNEYFKNKQFFRSNQIDIFIINLQQSFEKKLISNIFKNESDIETNFKSYLNRGISHITNRIDIKERKEDKIDKEEKSLKKKTRKRKE